MSVETLSGLGAARRAIFAGAVGAVESPGGETSGSLSSTAIAPSFGAYVLNRIGFGPRLNTLFALEIFNAMGDSLWLSSV